MPKVLYFVLLTLCCLSVRAQTNSVALLEKKVIESNDALEFEKAIRLISNFIADDERTPYEKYQAYLLKAYTYKRVFNYPEVLHNLDMALEQGLLSNEAGAVRNTIKSEKAIVYFDLREYKKASPLMTELSEDNYRYLSLENKAWIIMQEGYLLMLDKKYLESEQNFDAAIAILKTNSPRNLPNVYGKKVELYNAMKRYDKRDEAFNEGLRIAKQYKVIKYEMYLYQIMKHEYKKNDDYRNAYEHQQIYDSLYETYNAASHNGKIQVLEKALDEKQNQIVIQKEHNVKYGLIGMITVLILLLALSIRLYKISNQKKILVEKENTRIHDEIERLTKAIDEKGNARIDLSRFELSERQLQIIGLVKEGKSNKEIANLLFISENTVKYHLKVIYEILKIDHRTELIR